MSIELMLEALEEEEEYVDVWPALRVLMQRDSRIRRAVDLLRQGDIERAIGLLWEAGLEDDQIVYIISTVLQKPLPEAINVYRNIVKVRKTALTRPSRAKERASDVEIRIPGARRISVTPSVPSVNMHLNFRYQKHSVRAGSETSIYLGGPAAG